MAKLTPDLLKNCMPLTGGRIELRDDVESGLIFRVTDTGKRSWSVRYRSPAGQQRRKALGPYPAISLARAREEARKVRGAIASGTDVVAVERGEREALASRRLRTINGLGVAYFADAALGLHRPNARGPKRAGTITEEKRIFDRLIAPELGNTPIEDLKRADIQAFVTRQSRKSVVRPKGARGDGPLRPAVSNGRHCRTVLRQILAYAVWKGLLDTNAAHDIAVVMPEARERTFTDNELRAIWEACSRPQDIDGLSLSPEMGLALKFAAVTLQRGGEVIGARRAEIDRKARSWLIPAARMKSKRPHLVPLSSLALQLLDEADALIGGAEFIFESTRGTGDARRALERRSLSRAMGRIVLALKLPHATPHDLRRTGATAITGERIGITRFVVSQVLGHAGDTGGAAVVTGRHYDLNDYLTDKRRALDAWAILLEEIVGAIHRAPNVTTRR